jgi:hypothetical protein
MATSGTSSFTRARDQICHTAGRKIGAIRAGETMSNSMLTDFVEGLNLLVKHWQGKGLHVWTVTEATLFPQVAQVRYALALTGADHATRSFVATTAAVAASAAATTITVDDDDGILDNDHIGITLTDGTLFWTTVNGTPAECGDVRRCAHRRRRRGCCGLCLHDQDRAPAQNRRGAFL